MPFTPLKAKAGYRQQQCSTGICGKIAYQLRPWMAKAALEASDMKEACAVAVAQVCV